MKKKISIVFLFLILSALNHTNVNAKNLYFENAKKLFDNKNYKDSKFYFEKDIVFNPKSENSYLYLAKIFKEEKNIILEYQEFKFFQSKRTNSYLEFGL